MDPQKKRVYEWEDLFSSFGKRSETRQEIRKLIRSASKRYNVEPPAVRFVSRAKSPSLTITTYYDSSDHSISMGYRSCNAAIAMHEVAHAIVSERFEDEPDHGERWLGIYLDLLEWAGVAPRSALVASLKEKRLKWARNKAKL